LHYNNQDSHQNLIQPALSNIFDLRELSTWLMNSLFAIHESQSTHLHLPKKTSDTTLYCIAFHLTPLDLTGDFLDLCWNNDFMYTFDMMPLIHKLYTNDVRLIYANEKYQSDIEEEK
jgi:hypothetical protein